MIGSYFIVYKWGRKDSVDQRLCGHETIENIFAL